MKKKKNEKILKKKILKKNNPNFLGLIIFNPDV